MVLTLVAAHLGCSGCQPPRDPVPPAAPSSAPGSASLDGGAAASLADVVERALPAVVSVRSTRVVDLGELELLDDPPAPACWSPP